MHMKKVNFISNSKKIKLEITIQNQKIWKDLDNIFCIMVLDLLSKVTEDKSKRKTLVSILLVDDLYMKKIIFYIFLSMGFCIYWVIITITKEMRKKWKN